MRSLDYGDLSFNRILEKSPSVQLKMVIQEDPEPTSCPGQTKSTAGGGGREAGLSESSTPLHSAPSCQDHGLHLSRRDAAAGWAWAACPGCALPAVDSWGQPAACEPVSLSASLPQNMTKLPGHLATVPRPMPSQPLSSSQVCWAPPGAHICSFPVPCTHSSAPLLPARAR